MNKKVIWYIHPYAGSPKRGMSFRPHFLAKNFSAKNYQTILISSSFHHLASQDGLTLGLNEVEGQKLYLVKTREYFGNGIGRIINMFQFGLNLYRSKYVEQLRDQGKPDVIIASSAHPLHFFAAKYYAKKYRAKLILEVRDIWPMSLMELVGLKPYNPFCVLLAFIEKYAYKHCDNCVSLLSNSKTYMVEKGLSESKFFHIPNGIELPKTNETHTIALLSKLKNDGEFVLMYTGAHGVPNALAQLIDAAKILKNKKIKFVLVGDGIEKNNLIEETVKNNLSNVIFIDKVEKSLIDSYLSYADLCFIGAMDSKIYKYGISPNKVFDYMLAKKPILMAIDTVNDPVTLSGCGNQIPSGQPEILAASIENYFNMDIYMREKMGQLGYSYLLNNHTYSALAEKYIDLFGTRDA